MFGRIRSFRQVALLSLTFVASGCLPMGLPEYFSGMREPQREEALLLQKSQRNTASLLSLTGRVSRSSKLRRKPSIAMLVLPADIAEMRGVLSASERLTLGHQFLFGVIPLTRLYLQHGADSLATEVAIDLLRESGYQAVTVSADNYAAAAALLQPTISIRLSFKDLSVNAYDALFFRILSISGHLSLDVLRIEESGSAALLRRLPLELSKRSYRSSGHGTELAALLEQEIRGVLGAAIADLPDRRRGRGRKSRGSPEGTVLLLSLPEIADSLEQEAGALLAQSYGYADLHSFSAHTVRRIVQRGMEQGLRERELSPISLSSGPEVVADLPLRGAPVWHINARLSGFDATESSSQLSVHTLIRMQDLGSGARTLLLKRCVLTAELSESADGYRVVLLERAAAQMMQVLFTGDSTDAARCEDVEDRNGAV